MIEFGSRAKRLPAPPHIVFDSLVEPHKRGTRPWLELHGDETEPRVLEARPPALVVWSSIWPTRPEDQVRFDLTPQSGGDTLVKFTLLTPGTPPDDSLAGHVRYRMNVLLFAQLRYSYGN
ncbi:MAG: SRPBCC family protein [Nocardioides sp.]